MEIIVYVLVCWFMVSFASKFIDNYREIEQERETKGIKFVFLQIDVERINDLWYGWFISDDQEAFVAQGITYDDAVKNCKETLERRNPEYKIVFRFEKKYDEQPALQD